MRRIPAILLLVAAGCSTAPVADFLDLVAPGGPPPGPAAAAGWVPRPRVPVEPLPPPIDVPPLPPVPSDYTPRSTAPEPPAARLAPHPAG